MWRGAVVRHSVGSCDTWRSATPHPMIATVNAPPISMNSRCVTEYRPRTATLYHTGQPRNWTPSCLTDSLIVGARSDSSSLQKRFETAGTKHSWWSHGNAIVVRRSRCCAGERPNIPQLPVRSTRETLRLVRAQAEGTGAGGGATCPSMPSWGRECVDGTGRPVVLGDGIGVCKFNASVRQ